jgi:hypothetical protein
VYHYNLDTGTYHNPLQLRYSYHVKQRPPLDLQAMQAAADLLVGTHDFTQLSNDSPERLRRNPIKTLHRLDVVQVTPDHVRLEVSRDHSVAAVCVTVDVPNAALASYVVFLLLLDLRASLRTQLSTIVLQQLLLLLHR